MRFAHDLILWPPTKTPVRQPTTSIAAVLPTCYLQLTPHRTIRLCCVKADFLNLLSPSRALQSVADLAFQHNPPPVLLVFGHRTRIAYSLLSLVPLQPHQSFFSVVFPSSSFLHSGSHNFFLAFFRYSFFPYVYTILTCDFINFTIPAPRNQPLISPYLLICSDSPAFFFFYVTINCSYIHPYEYSKNINFF